MHLHQILKLVAREYIGYNLVYQMVGTQKSKGQTHIDGIMLQDGDIMQNEFSLPSFSMFTS